MKFLSQKFSFKEKITQPQNFYPSKILGYTVVVQNDNLSFKVANQNSKMIEGEKEVNEVHVNGI